MPGGIPAVPGAKVVKALERAGFTVVRVSGRLFPPINGGLHCGDTERDVRELPVVVSRLSTAGSIAA